MSITLFTEGDELYAAMLDSIAGARRSVSLETYIFAADEVGERFVQALAERARAGIDVRLQVDAFGSLWVFPRARQAFLEAQGVRVRRFHRWQWRAPWRYNRRDHRKLLVVDAATAYLGGFNIHRQSSRRYSGDRRWRDTHVQLPGKLAAGAQQQFELFWRGRRRRDLPLSWDGGSVLLSNHNYRARKRLRRLLDQRLADARRSIWLANPYFVPDRAMQRRLIGAAGRGVDVRLLLPAKTDAWLVRWASHAAYAQLLANGVRIFEYQPRILHAKTMLVDNRWGMVGTSNLDYRSLRDNYEINLLSHAPSLCADLERQYRVDLEQATEVISRHWSRRRWHHYLTEAIGWAARRWL